ncbi:growth-regulated alpha protein-like [Lampetra planeri]
MDSRALLLLLLGLVLLSQAASGLPPGFRICPCWGFASKHEARHVRCVEKGRGGPICKKHVLATIWKGSQLCLNPKWHWVKRLIKRVGYCSQ